MKTSSIMKPKEFCSQKTHKATFKPFKNSFLSWKSLTLNKKTN